MIIINNNNFKNLKRYREKIIPEKITLYEILYKILQINLNISITYVTAYSTIYNKRTYNFYVPTNNVIYLLFNYYILTKKRFLRSTIPRICLSY